ncbi:hypothetical protein ACFOKJ_07865 [Vogesella amnigena]|uniref:TonB C-terminal domain-containing protein n=1 Tax=Vogesella amnigena TaxID=1507449 RepID=A0ABV7TTG3_9NEIS
MKRPSGPSKRGAAACWQHQQPLLLSVLLALAAHVALLLLPLAPADRPAAVPMLQVALPAAVPPAAAPPPPALTVPAAAIPETGAQPASAAVAEPAQDMAEPDGSRTADAAAEMAQDAGAVAASEPWPGLALDPYYPAAELDVLAAPIGPLLLDYPRAQPQPLDLQLYISREGMVDKVEVVAGNADSDYARFVLASFQQARFMPALKGGVPVRSRKHIRVALQP